MSQKDTPVKRHIDHKRDILEISREHKRALEQFLELIQQETDILGKTANIVQERMQGVTSEIMDLCEKTQHINLQRIHAIEGENHSAEEQMSILRRMKEQNEILEKKVEQDRLAWNLQEEEERKAQEKVETLERDLQMHQQMVTEHRQTFTRMQQEQTNFDIRMENKNAFLNDLFQEKRRLNCELQEIKGNIRVICRIRPLSALEQRGTNLQPYYSVEQDVLIFKLPKQCLKSENHRREYTFNFDEIFDNASQEEVFEEVSPLIDNILEGKNVCIFAYGQTGSGKTFTMQGGEKEESEGIIPKSIRYMFSVLKDSKEHNCTYKMNIQCVEIYNDEIRDILNKENGKKDTISTFAVEYEAEIHQYLKIASKNRVIAGTNCNERSSRSHLIFTIRLFAINTQTGDKKESCLNLIDLAGSERTAQSKVEGERMKETTSINLSLSTLSQVIQALAKKSAYIPYRNSKLTQFLEPFLSGESKTLTMMCISPLSKDWYQTQSSLQFAENVKKVCTLQGNNQGDNEVNRTEW